MFIFMIIKTFINKVNYITYPYITNQIDNGIKIYFRSTQVLFLDIKIRLT